MPAVIDMREKLFTMRMNADEAEQMKAVGTHYGLSAAALIRFLLKREARSIAKQESPSPTAKARKAKR